MEDQINITKGKLTYELSPYHAVSYVGIFCFCKDITIDNNGEKAGLIMEYCHIDGKEQPKILVHFTELNEGIYDTSALRTPLGYSGIPAVFSPFYWDRKIMSAVIELFRLIVKEIRIKNAADMIDFTKPVNEDLNIWRIRPSFIDRVLEVPFLSYLKIAMEDEMERPDVIDGELEILNDETVPILTAPRTLQLIETGPSCYFLKTSDDGKFEANFYTVRQGLCTVEFPDTVYKIYQVAGDAYRITARGIYSKEEDPFGLIIRIGDVVLHDPGCVIRLQEN